MTDGEDAVKKYLAGKELKFNQPATDSLVVDKYVVQDKRFADILPKAQELFARKNRKYRNAIVRTGVLGAAVEFVGISARLEALVIDPLYSSPADADDVRNALMDGVVYGIIGLMMLEDGNWKGER